MGIWCVESDERPRTDQHFCSGQTISWASVCTVGLLEMVRFCWTLLQQMNQLIPSTVAIIHWKDYCWSSNTLATCVKRQLKGKDTDAGKDWGQEEKRARGEEGKRGWDGWMSSLTQHEFGKTPGNSGGQRRRVCYHPWGCKELDMT